MSNLEKFMALAVSYIAVVLACIFIPKLAGIFAVISLMFSVLGLFCLFGGVKRNERSIAFYGVASIINVLVGIGLTSAMPLLTIGATCAVVISIFVANRPRK